MNTPHPALRLGVTVMPEWFQCEGIEAVLDRLQAAGATALVTSPYLLSLAPQGEGAREPPPDGEAGGVRPLDRALWGRHETWVRTAPSLTHGLSRYAGLRYQPSPAGELTHAQPGFMDQVLDRAHARGLQVYLQVMAASPPGYRVQFSAAVAQDQCRGPDGQLHPDRVDRNASLASPHVHAYGAALLAELAERYPQVTGFRIDWPEYPPYDLRSALFDFSEHGQQAIAAQGADPLALSRELSAAMARWRDVAVQWAGAGAQEVRDRLRDAGWDEWLAADGPARALWASKRASVRQMLQAYRQALDAVPGHRRLLEPQVFPQPLSTWSGFAWECLPGVCDAVGLKLYTMHWPMIARYWARDLIGTSQGPAADHLTQALFEWMGMGQSPVPLPASRLVYPPPDVDHPVGEQAQVDKLHTARLQAGDTPVIAFAHSYGPEEDFMRRFRLAAAAVCAPGGSGRVWVNRYGYLSERKLALLGQCMRERVQG
jgi:hypothetical protein